MWAPLFRRRPRLPFELIELETPDGDVLRTHRLGVGDEDPPVAVLLHGLEGSVSSHYIGGQASSLRQRGFSVVVMEHRSCGTDQLNRARRLYHSGETSDLDFLVRSLIDGGARRVYVWGVSLGGNVVAKWLGEDPDGLPAEVRGGAVVSPPYDLTISGPALDAALGGLYTRRFLRSLVPKALAKERQYPGSMDREALARARTFREFDTLGTAALHGFDDAEDYWRRVGCGQFLDAVRVPTLLISAADDPFNPGRSLPRDITTTNPAVTTAFSERGGHVGFVYGRPWRLRFWAEEATTAFFTALERERGEG